MYRDVHVLHFSARMKRLSLKQLLPSSYYFLYPLIKLNPSAVLHLPMHSRSPLFKSVYVNTTSLSLPITAYELGC